MDAVQAEKALAERALAENRAAIKALVAIKARTANRALVAEAGVVRLAKAVLPGIIIAGVKIVAIGADLTAVIIGAGHDRVAIR